MSSTLAATQCLTAEEQAAYDFIADDFPNLQRFMEQAAAVRTTNINAAVVTQIAAAGAVLQTKYCNRLAVDLVDGRVHMLERDYESVLRSMIAVSENMKAALAAPTKVLAVAAMQVALREVPRLKLRVGWTAHELDALRAYADGGGSLATAGRSVRRKRRTRLSIPASSPAR